MTKSDKSEAAYPVYTTEFDRIVSARTLASEVAPNLPSEFAAHSGFVGDDRSGLRHEADAEALALASVIPDAEATVQILLDMSGSNRGQHVQTIAFVDLMARSLEKAGVPFEVLGYTTGAWKGGRAMEKWKAIPRDERPRDVGRCNELLHVVFKERDESWTAGTDGLSPADLLDGLYRAPHLKENIDGEALRWALGRHGEGETRMVFVNDGRSVDDATMSLNGPDILQQDRGRALDEIKAAGVRLTVMEVSSRGSDNANRSLWGDEERIVVDVGTDPAKAVHAILDAALAPGESPAPGR